jgi:uncharacterized membrane protein (DUF485 family)
MPQSTRTPIDWRAAHDLPQFKALRSRRNRFVRGAAATIFTWFLVFLLVIGAAPEFAATQVVPGITVGYLLGLSQFVLAWVVTWRYLRFSDRVLDRLEQEVHAEVVRDESESRSEP